MLKIKYGKNINQNTIARMLMMLKIRRQALNLSSTRLSVPWNERLLARRPTKPMTPIIGDAIPAST